MSSHAINVIDNLIKCVRLGATALAMAPIVKRQYTIAVGERTECFEVGLMIAYTVNGSVSRPSIIQVFTERATRLTHAPAAVEGDNQGSVFRSADSVR